MTQSTTTFVRRARQEDATALGRLGAALLHLHFGFDNRRFMAPGDDPASGYAWFLASQLGDPDVAVFVAERDRAVIGYVYASLEPQSWQELREAAGFIHDVVVEENGRRLGVASELVAAAVAWLREHGAPRVMLWTAEQNDSAKQLFEKLGFRRTMIEMTREL